MDLTLVLFFLFGIGSGLGAFFLSYQQISESLRESNSKSLQLYERRDLWRTDTSRGSQNPL